MIVSVLVALAPGRCGAQGTTVVPDLRAVPTANRWTLFNRGAEAREAGVWLDARPGLGAAWLDSTELSDGVVEVTLRGRDVAQASFVGVAFRGVDDDRFEAVYFRPFNFRAADPVSRSHSVQYVAHPEYTWQRLRAESPGAYEAELRPAPDPNASFTARIEFVDGRVRVFVNDASAPCLDVAALGSGHPGKVGLWVGNNSDGLFSHLSISSPRPEPQPTGSVDAAEPPTGR